MRQDKKCLLKKGNIKREEMMKLFIYSLMSGFMLGIWPLLARLSGLTSTLLSIWMFTTMGIIMMTYGVYHYTSTKSQLPNGKQILIIMAAGILNLLGMLLYNALISNKNADISRYIPMTLALIPVILAIGGSIFFHETLTTNKAIGLTLAVAGIWFLAK